MDDHDATMLRAKTSPVTRPQLHLHSSIEALEKRIAPAVIVKAANGDVFISGDSTANHIAVFQDGGGNLFIYGDSSTTIGGDGTVSAAVPDTNAGGGREFNSGLFSKITISMGSGNDTVEFSGLRAADVKGLTIDTGDSTTGDRVQFQQTNFVGNPDTNWGANAVAGSVTITTGSGPDTVLVKSLAAADLSIHTKGGSDAITIDFADGNISGGTVDGGAGTNSATLTGGDGSFTVTASRAGTGLVVGGGPGISFTGIDSVIGGTGADTLFNKSGQVFAAATQSVAGIAATNFGTVSTPALLLNATDDSFTVSATGTATFGGKNYINLASVDAGAGTADTIIASANADFVLTDSSLKIGSFNLALSHFEVANLTGGASANAFTVTDWTGKGTISAGAGDDTVTIGAFTLDTIDGGGDSDSLHIVGAGHSLDLTTLANSRLTGFEDLNLRGTGDNTLKLDVSEVLALSGTSDTVVVHHDLTDSVDIGAGWTTGAQETIGTDHFDVYTSGAATLKVQSATQFGATVPITLVNAHTAVFTDVDGDFVTVAVDKGTLKQSDFHLVLSGVGTQLQSIDFTGDGAEFQNAYLTVSVHKLGAGDGLVNVGRVNAQGIDLGLVRVAGDLGQVDAGDANLTTVGLGALNVGSLGAVSGTQAAGTLDPLHSEIVGKLNSLTAKTKVAGVLDVSGVTGSIKVVTILGDLDGSAGGAEAGLIRTTGSITAINVFGSVKGGADFSGIIAGAKLGIVTIKHDLSSADPLHPVLISALGTPGAAPTITGLTVKGDVTNARVLAGYGFTTVPVAALKATNADASIGAIRVNGNWSASSVAAGVQDNTSDGFGRNDTLIPGGSAAVVAKIASITIVGAATGSSTAGDFFGLTAEKILSASIHGKKINVAGPATHLLLDVTNADFGLVELS